MPKYTVYLYRKMRLSFTDVEADSPRSAVEIVSVRSTDDADNVEDCPGENLSARVDVAGDENYSLSESLDFEPERHRKAAAMLLTALSGVIDYAQNEAYCLDRVRDTPESDLEAERAWKAIELARGALAEAEAARISRRPSDNDIHALLTGRRQIALVWGIDDVLEVRPNLSADQAWTVLKTAEAGHDARCGVSYETLEWIAGDLFGAGPAQADEAWAGAAIGTST